MKISTRVYSLFSVLCSMALISSGFASDCKIKEMQKIYGDPDKVICVSIPKCGTHLLIKCLTLLEIDGIKYNYNTEKVTGKRYQTHYEKLTAEEYGDRAFSRLTYRINKNKDLRPSYLIHLPFHKKYKCFFDNFTVKNFLMIRDPRDQLISLASTSLKDSFRIENGS